MVASSMLNGFGNLTKLLPTATVIAFQFFSPIATNNGDCPSVGYKRATTSAAENVDLRPYRLRWFEDLVHALLSLFVFALVGLFDLNIVHCFYPGLESDDLKPLMMALPPAIGTVVSAVFMSYPSHRHGIGIAMPMTLQHQYILTNNNPPI
ncbi:Protein DMP [Sesbania bispinosa]|nr:Protein DMP [Sesbania bispinosa]